MPDTPEPRMVVPAPPGWVLLHYWRDEGPSSPAVLDVHPVLWWETDGDSVFPVTPEGPAFAVPANNESAPSTGMEVYSLRALKDPGGTVFLVVDGCAETLNTQDWRGAMEDRLRRINERLLDRWTRDAERAA